MSRSRRAPATPQPAGPPKVPYPQPGPTGGKLMRQLIAGLKAAQLPLPIDSHILIACSAGPDSTALAHALLKYGRRGGRRSLIRLLHVNHAWRGKESDADARFVRQLGKRFGVPVTIHTLPPPRPSGESLEEIARNDRKRIFEEEAARHKAVVFTAHQADDVAETLLWRILTGQGKTHGAAIAPRHGVEARPLLAVRKRDLVAYLKEEGQDYRLDATNLEGRFLRSRMRLELMPAIEKLFPRAVEHLVALAKSASAETPSSHLQRISADALAPIGAFLGSQGLKLRRGHWEGLIKQASRGASEKGGASPGEIHLPGGWRILHDPRSRPRRWVIEAKD